MLRRSRDPADIPGTPPPATRRAPSPLEAAMAVQAETIRDDQAADIERARRMGALFTDSRRADMRLHAATLEQQRRNQAGEGTPIEEVLDSRNRSLAREFLHFMRRAYDDDGFDRYELATVLPVGQGDSRRNVRGFLIGCAGDEPGDSGWIKDSRGLYLCEDGTLRTYRRPDQPVEPDDLPSAEGVPIHPATGEYVNIVPGYFTKITAARRRIVKPSGGRVPPLPPGAESGSQLYRDAGSKVSYQSHEVHLYRAQTLEESLAATAHYAIALEQQRPMYDRYSPEI